LYGPAKSNLLVNIKRNLVYNFILSVSQVLLPLVSIPYVSRVLDPDGIGRVSFIDSFTYYFVIISELGITVYGVREVARNKLQPERLRQLVSELLTLHVIASAISLVVYLAGVFILFDRIGDERLVLFSISFLLVNFFSCDWYFMGIESFKWITVRNISIRLLGLLLLFLLVRQPTDYYVYYGIIALSAVAVSLWNILTLVRKVKLSFRIDWGKHLPSLRVTYLISLLYSVPLMLDNVLLGLVGTASAVGIYAFSIKIVRTSTNLITDSFLVFFPRVASLSGSTADGELRQKLLLNVQFVILLSLPMGAGIYLLSGELANVFLGQKFSAAGDNLRVLSVYPFLKGISLFLSNPVLIAHNREKNYLNNLIASTALFVASALVLGYYFSDFGICMALIVAELFLLILNYFSAKASLNWVPLFDFATFGQALAGSLLFIPIIYLVQSTVTAGWLRLVYGILGCTAFYGGFLILIKNNFAMQVKRLVLTSVQKTS
jgi:O-antigen/teichoic acid export membrane protein